MLPIHSYLFWSDMYRPAVITRAYTDGSNAMPLVNTTLGMPYGLALDYGYATKSLHNIPYVTVTCFIIIFFLPCVRLNRLYWVDSLLNQIGSVSITGSDRLTFSNLGQITQPYSLTVYSGRIRYKRMIPEYSIYCIYNIQIIQNICILATYSLKTPLYTFSGCIPTSVDKMPLQTHITLTSQYFIYLNF